MKQQAADTWIWLLHQAKKPPITEEVAGMMGIRIQSHRPAIPPQEFWPKGFDGGNAVSGWFNKWLKFQGFRQLFNFHPFTLVDIAPLAWWHDLWYYLGYFVPWSTSLEKLKTLKPRPRSQRNWIQRRACDRHFRIGLHYLGLPRWRAKMAWRALNKLGSKYYFYGGPTWTHDT